MLIKKYTIQPTYGSPLIDHTPEDSCLVSDRYLMAVVADGVTILDRNSNGTYPVFPDGNSGPKKISDVFCQKVIQCLEEKYPEINLDVIRMAFEEGNKEVGSINQKLLGIDPDDPNYGAESFATVAAVTCLINNQLIYGFLTDCGISVIARNAQLKFITPEIWSRIERPSDKRLQSILKKGEGGYYNYRNYVRNNSELVVKGEFYSHGVVNGQKGMSKYIEFGQQQLNQEDTVIVFTDGFRHYFRRQEFLKILSESNLCEFEKKLDFLGFDLLRQSNPVSEYGLERTLILLRR